MAATKLAIGLGRTLESARGLVTLRPMKGSLILSGTLGPLLLLATSCVPSGTPESVSGTIETDEVRVASRYGGRVETILAQEGDLLKPGQVIAILAAPELLARREQAQALLAELEAGPRPQEIAAAKHDWESAAAEMEFVQLDSRRLEELFLQKTASAADRDRAVSQAAVTAKRVAAAQSRYELLLAGTRPERIAQAKAQLAELATQFRELDILSPTNAVLEVLGVKAGDVLAPNREVATLLLTHHLWVRVFVPEPWLGRIQLGETVRVRVDSFPGKDFAGRVEQIARAAEFTPRNVQTVGERVKQVFGIKVRLDGTSGELRAGMAADVVFPQVAAKR